MVRRLFAGLFAVTVTASLLTLVSAGPAQAQTSGGCSFGELTLTVEHSPQQFKYSVHNFHNTTENNVNIRIYDAQGKRIWSWDSPDNRVAGREYTSTPPVVVPTGGFVHFIAIFDVGGWVADPRCLYSSRICCNSNNGWIGGFQGHHDPIQSCWAGDNRELRVYATHTKFHYLLTDGNSKSNVNIVVYDSSHQHVWSRNSPDNRQRARWYEQVPGVSVPAGGYIVFTGIFDKSGPDPRCSVAAFPLGVPNPTPWS